VTRNLSGRKCGAETVGTAFTDHLAKVLRLAFDAPTIRRGRGYWKMNATPLQGTHFQDKLQQQWMQWVQQRKYYPEIMMCCERVAKTQICELFIREGMDRRRKDITMEKYCHACLFDLLQYPTHRAEQMAAVNRLKAKLVKLYRARLSRGTVDKHTQESFQEERMPLFHPINGDKEWATGNNQSAEPDQRQTDVYEGYCGSS